MTETNISTEAELKRCKELIVDAAQRVLRATNRLEQLPETMRSDFEGDIRHDALHELYASFSKLYRAEWIVHRAIYTPPADLKNALDSEDDLPDSID